MSSPQQELSDSSSVPARHRRLGMWLSIVAVTAGIVALVAVMLLRAGAVNASNRSVASGPVSAPLSTGWQTFHDPFGLYTLRLPPGWAAQGGPATETEGIGFSSATTIMEGYHFTSLPANAASAFVFINADPIKTTADRQSVCQYVSHLQKGTFDGFRAAYSNSALWYFVTENVQFTVAITIPGVEEPSTLAPPTRLATPLPTSLVATYQADVNGIVASFQPSNPKPLAC